MMLVQAAVGAALAMFLREWHLEDLQKIRKLQAEEQLAEQNKDNEDNNDDESESTIASQETENNPTINNNETNNQTTNKIEPENNTTQLEPTEIQLPTNELTAAENKINDKIEIEPQTEESPVAENNSADNEIPPAENYDFNTDNEEQNNTPTENKNNPSDYKVDEIIKNMLSDNAEQIDDLAASPETPTSIFDLPFDPTQFDPQAFDFNNNNDNNTTQENIINQIKNDYENETNPIDDFATEFNDATIESDKNNQIDFANSPNEYKNSNATTSTQNISQTAVEILGENFDFNSLLAASKVVDNSEPQTNPQPTQQEPTNNTPDYNFTNVIESVAISPPSTEFFAQQSHESTPTFAPDMIQKNDTQTNDTSLNFTESPPPIYIRKKKIK